MNNEPENPTEVIILDRGMNRDECKAMCTSPQIPLREKLFFRIIDEITARLREVLEARIELWNRTTGEITFPIPKSKYKRLHFDLASAIIRIMPYLHMKVWQPVLTSLENEANLVYEDFLSFYWK